MKKRLNEEKIMRKEKEPQRKKNNRGKLSIQNRT